MKKLTDAERWKILAKADLNQAASLLGEKTSEKAEEIAEELGVGYMAEVVSQLGSETAAELLRNLPQDFGLKVLSEVKQDRAESIREVMSYPEGTAGALMSKEYLAVPSDTTLMQATEYLQSAVSQNRIGKVSYIYVVDAERRLLGVIQIRDLIFHPPDKKVSEILKGPVVQVETRMSQADVAKLLERHRYLGLPVVDENQRLAGVISADSALQAAQDEASDDIAKLVGTSAKEIRSSSVSDILRLRLPWLSFSIVSGLFCAFLSGLFQNTLTQITVLFLFVPVVLGLSESIGVQGATIIVRNIALGISDFRDLSGIFFREVAAGVFIGLICGALVGSIAYFWKSDDLLGMALATSMTAAIFISGVIGLSLPILFRQIRFDPAIASGPIVLAICDIQTLLVYFSVSSWILSG